MLDFLNILHYQIFSRAGGGKVQPEDLEAGQAGQTKATGSLAAQHGDPYDLGTDPTR